MRYVLTAGIALLSLASALRARDEPPGAKATPTQQYRAVRDDYRKASDAFTRQYRRAKTRADRARVEKEKAPDTGSYVARVLAIVDGAPDDPAAVDALIWAVQIGELSPKTAAAIERLAKRHAADPKLDRVLTPLSRHADWPPTEDLIRAIAGSSKNRNTRGHAWLTLGRFLKRQAEALRTLKMDKERARKLDEGWTKAGLDPAVLEQFKKRNPDDVTKAALEAYQRAGGGYSRVRAGQSTVGELAVVESSELRERGELKVGQPAPEIVGKDLDGRTFRLSDYRGNVVVIDFWGDW